jgi:hypothetical protein
MKMKATFLSGKRKRLKPYPASVPMRTVPAIVMAETMMLLRR